MAAKSAKALGDALKLISGFSSGSAKVQILAVVPFISI